MPHLKRPRWHRAKRSGQKLSQSKHLRNAKPWRSAIGETLVQHPAHTWNFYGKHIIAGCFSRIHAPGVARQHEECAHFQVPWIVVIYRCPTARCHTNQQHNYSVAHSLRSTPWENWAALFQPVLKLIHELGVWNSKTSSTNSFHLRVGNPGRGKRLKKKNAGSMALLIMNSVALDALDRPTLTWFNYMNPRGDMRSVYANILRKIADFKFQMNFKKICTLISISSPASIPTLTTFILSRARALHVNSRRSGDIPMLMKDMQALVRQPGWTASRKWRMQQHTKSVEEIDWPNVHEWQVFLYGKYPICPNSTVE